jgi:acetyl-CoA C-acetyltransferase
LVFSTAATAETYGVPRERWLFPLVSVESNHSVPVTSRANLVQPGAMQAMARASYAATGVKPSDIELLDLYSCFPFAVKMAAEGLDLDETRDLTITGGMAFAGGPLNNYVLQTTCRAAELMHEGRGKRALISCISGLYTKQGLTIWSTEAPNRPFCVVDVTDEVDLLEPSLTVADGSEGRGEVAGCTVLFVDGEPERAVAVVSLSNGERTVAKSLDPAVMEQVMTEECVGRAAVVSAGSFRLTSPQP